MIFRKKKIQNIEEEKENIQKEFRQLPQINQPQSNNNMKTQDQDTPPSENINHE